MAAEPLRTGTAGRLMRGAELLTSAGALLAGVLGSTVQGHAVVPQRERLTGHDGRD